MTSRRLYSWTQISGWRLAEAMRAGELKVFCPRPDCEHVAPFRTGQLKADEKLWAIARRMRCRACARRGGQFEIWSAGALGRPMRD
jgi:hypothetical protein